MVAQVILPNQPSLSKRTSKVKLFDLPASKNAFFPPNLMNNAGTSITIMQTHPSDADLIAVTRTEAYARCELGCAEGGHDWWHARRVQQMASRIASTEGGDPTIIALAALLHDIADPKFHAGDESIGPTRARAFLTSIALDEKCINRVVSIIENISFKGGLGQANDSSLELQIVQDADRLDALGAIGIARTFHYGGFKNRPIHDPEWTPRPYQSVAEYRNTNAPSIQHFHDKLLLLKDRMNTKTARTIAERRHRILVDFLEQFQREWNGDPES
jgi:uncharacterized protein